MTNETIKAATPVLTSNCKWKRIAVGNDPRFRYIAMYQSTTSGEYRAWTQTAGLVGRIMPGMVAEYLNSPHVEQS